MSTLSPQAASSLATTGVVEHAHPSIVDWAAIIAGGLLATAISFILITFGSAIGLSLTSPYEGSGFSAAFFAVAVGLWVVWVQISSLSQAPIWLADCGGGCPMPARMRLRCATAPTDCWSGL